MTVASCEETDCTIAGIMNPVRGSGVLKAVERKRTFTGGLVCDKEHGDMPEEDLGIFPATN
jgi:hypothetical protein